MKRTIKIPGLICLLILTVVLLNEYNRFSLNEGVQNTATFLTEKCTWACHNNTEHCKTHHVKWLRDYFSYTDPLYFGLINRLKLTGKYAFANVLLLGLLMPLILTYLFVRILEMQQVINKSKR